MEYIIILVLCIAIILILKIIFKIKIKDLKKIKDIGYDSQLNEITNQLPSNKEVCQQILKDIQNENVTIQINEEKGSKLTYYMVLTNHIIIADIKDTFTRIQTIAHECLHSIQSRKVLLFNFVFSNIYLIYFFIISVLTILKVIKEPMIYTSILILFSFIYYAVRSYLETDAMTKAPYFAKQYIEKQENISNEDLEIIMENYTKINNIGIPMTNFQLISSTLIKIIIYCIIAIIMTI